MTMKVVSVSEDDLLLTRFADGIVVNAGGEEEAGVLVDRLDTQGTIGDRPRQDKSGDKQPKWLPKRYQDKRSEATRSGQHQVPWSNHLQRRIKTRDYFQDSPDNSSSF